MKKLLSAALAIVMLFALFTIPCAADAGVDFRVDVSYDYDTKVISFEGNVSTAYGSRDITYYLLYPNKGQDDIVPANGNDPVVSHYGQVKADSEGAFSSSFRYSGDVGTYTLFINSGSVLKAFSIDTSKDMDIVSQLQLSELYRLPSKFDAITTTNVRDAFFIHKDEYGTEMPVVSPREVDGLYTVYVDIVNGDDATATGDIDAPYKTIKAALSANNPESGMVLCLREGNYPASETLYISNIKATETAPFFVTSYEGEEVNVIGGAEIAANQFEKVTDSKILSRLDHAISGNIMVADLKEMGITDFGEITTSSSPVLFVGDSKYTIARWPNVELTGMMHIKDALGEEMAAIYEDLNTGYTQSRGTGVIDCGIITTSMGSPCGNYRKYSKRGTSEGTKDEGAEFCVEDIRPFSWVDTGNIWMYVSLHDEWTHDHVRVAEFNPETRSVRTLTSNSWGTQYKDCNKFYYYNILEELDAPGEWFVDDKTGKLYIYPATDIKDEKVMFAPSADTMWTFENCENVIINGINFEHARGQALKIKGINTEKVVVQNCKFSDVGTGVTIEGKYSGIINSEFVNVTEGRSIALNGGNEDKDRVPPELIELIPMRQFAQNNKIYNSKGISVSEVGGIVSHNYLSNVIGSCIYLTKARECVVEYNEIVAGPRETLDSGAIYLNGNQQFNRGNHVRYNYIHETGASIGDEIPQSIYFDDMASENYAYGNFIVGGRMLFHNGSETSIYNNIVMSTPGTYQPININPNYYKQATGSSTSPRWRRGALEYGTFTSALKSGSAFNDGNGNIAKAYADRYPKLAAWATLMYERIAEYEAAGKTSAASKTSSIDSPVSGVNLNAYLAASRENHLENNVFINAPSNDNVLKYGLIKGDGVAGEGKKNTGITELFKPWAIEPVVEAGHINPYAANNVSLSNPFTGTNYGDKAAYDTIIKTVPSFEPIPFNQIGLTNTKDYPKNDKTVAITPVHSAEATVIPTNVSLKWKAVTGAQMYKVEISDDTNFGNIIEENTSFEMAYQLTKALDADKYYYWRVTTIPVASNVTGSEMTSDTFMFKTLSATAGGNFNKFGVTDYALVDDDGNVLEAIPENGEFKVCGYAYNLTGNDMGAEVHIACYNQDGNLIAVKTCYVEATGDPGLTIYKESSSLTDSGRDADGAFSGKFITEKFKAPGTKNIKIFTWSIDGNMIPYSFVKEIK